LGGVKLNQEIISILMAGKITPLRSDLSSNIYRFFESKNVFYETTFKRNNKRVDRFFKIKHVESLGELFNILFKKRKTFDFIFINECSKDFKQFQETFYPENYSFC